VATGEVPAQTMQGSPYGHYATEAGQAALRSVDHLADDPVWRGGTQRRWLESDYTTFARMVACLSSLDLARSEVGAGPPCGHLNRLQSNIAILRAAVPFTEGERHWLEDKGSRLHRVNPIFPRDFAHWIKVDAGEPIIYEAGRQRRIVGREILDAWWAWRRAVFEFEGQESVDLARQALHGIGAILIPRVATVADTQEGAAAEPEQRLLRLPRHLRDRLTR